MYFARRLLALIPLLLVITFLAFVLVRVAPGGPFDKERAPASPEIERQLKAKYHLDENIVRQYDRFLGGLVLGEPLLNMQGVLTGVPTFITGDDSLLPHPHKKK